MSTKRYRYREGELAPKQIQALCAVEELREHARQVRNACRAIVGCYRPGYDPSDPLRQTPEQLYLDFIVAALDDARTAYEAMKREGRRGSIEFDEQREEPGLLFVGRNDLKRPRLKLAPPRSNVIGGAHRFRRAQ